MGCLKENDAYIAVLHGGVDFGAGITARRLSNLVEIEI